MLSIIHFQRSLLIAAILLFSASVTASSRFEGGRDGRHSYELNLPESECRWVDNGGGEVMTLSIEYPSMKVVKPRVGNSVITIRMFPVLRPSFREGAFLEGVKPFKVVEGVEFYDYGGFITRTFDGGEGETVFATDHERFWLGKRLFKDLRVSYQYARNYEDIRFMDRFVMSFLEQVIVR
ncbi:hypothetical protein F2A37_19795 [Pseudomonas chlororaphis]|jgi:hypothetical protein|uniref:hypothetical protein n=1 Tax=Pseudomonas chlororaphis TaxID=587753 RepID=UPI000F574D9A|nr:hypothetical protein [Pseudomonas chlororaphis]KAA5840649.1 hypothetical protein F2A37_19795 [Pseudomonas chlororaphis]